MDTPCPPLSVWHPYRQAPLETLAPSHQCTTAANLIAFFGFFIAFNSLHLIYSLYRICSFRYTGHTWKQLSKYHGCLVELAADIVTVIANSFYITGMTYIGYALQWIFAALQQVALMTNTFRTIATVIEPFEADMPTQLSYVRTVRAIMLLATLQVSVGITASYFFYTRDFRSFAISACITYAVQLGSGLYITRVLYHAAALCQNLLTSTSATETAQGHVATGFNTSLFNGKGQIHAEVQSRRKLILDACKRVRHLIPASGILTSHCSLRLMLRFGRYHGWS